MSRFLLFGLGFASGYILNDIGFRCSMNRDSEEVKIIRELLSIFKFEKSQKSEKLEEKQEWGMRSGPPGSFDNIGVRTKN